MAPTLSLRRGHLWKVNRRVVPAAVIRESPKRRLTESELHRRADGRVQWPTLTHARPPSAPELGCPDDIVARLDSGVYGNRDTRAIMETLHSEVPTSVGYVQGLGLLSVSTTRSGSFPARCTDTTLPV